jgi:hypothetical protein
MNPRILIITDGDDLHSIAVSEALSIHGIEATLWPTADFPTRSEETFHFEGFQRSVLIKGASFSLNDDKFDVVWRRRPSYVLDADLLHPSDRAFADAECGMFRRSSLSLLSPQAFWVNPPQGAARASSKMIQHQASIAVGLQMPETLYSNSPHEVRSFIRTRGGSSCLQAVSPYRVERWNSLVHALHGTPFRRISY